MKCVKFLLAIFSITFLFSINKTYVLDLDFQGNHNVPDDKLAELLRLQKKTFIATTEFKTNKLNLDLLSIQSFYKSKGYLDVEVDYAYDYADESNINIQFFINEGYRYQIRKISIIGNKYFKDSFILDMLELESEFYNPSYIRKQLLSLKNEYMKIGKINISIKDEVVKDGNLIDLNIYISEGNKFYIDRITISGLDRIDQKLVMRELIFNVGDLYNIESIDISKSHLFESQLFSSVEMFPYVSSDTTVALDIRIREIRNREIEFEFGFSQLPSNQGDLPVSAINALANYDRSNLFNSATKLSFKTEYGISYSDDSRFLRSYYELGLYSPWFIKVRIPFRFKIYNESILFKSLVLGDRKTGIITYIENYRSSNPYLSAGLITEFFESNKNQNRSIYASYMKHNIKNFINPSDGYYISINPRLNGTFLGGAYNYFKSDFELKLFKTIFDYFIFATRAKTGFIHLLNTSNEPSISQVPDFDKFFLGGASSLRGWTSPVDYNSEVGGLFRTLLNFEIRFPVYKILGLEFFYDGGVITPDLNNNFSGIKEEFNWNVGWGIVIQSNLGPARIDFAFKRGVGERTVQVSLLNMF